MTGLSFSFFFSLLWGGLVAAPGEGRAVQLVPVSARKHSNVFWSLVQSLDPETWFLCLAPTTTRAV